VPENVPHSALFRKRRVSETRSRGIGAVARGLKRFWRIADPQTAYAADQISFMLMSFVYAREWDANRLLPWTIKL
jgi:hypothetical protein